MIKQSTTFLLGALLLLSACECGSDICQRVDAESAVTPGTAADFKQNVRNHVYFAYDSAEIQSSADDVLNQQAAWFKVHANTTATVSGHCDVRGSGEYNMALGKKRADAAASYLKKAGVDMSRLKVMTYGKEKPAVPDAKTEAEHAQNRYACTEVD